MKDGKKHIIKKGKNRLHDGAFYGGLFILTAALVIMMAFQNEILEAVGTVIKGLL